MTPSLSDLPADVLLAMCEHLGLLRPCSITTVARFERHEKTGFLEWSHVPAELIALSLTCKQLRQLCSPIIFRVYVLETATEHRIVSRSAAAHTRRLYIHKVQMTATRFRHFLRAMPNLREAYVTDSPHLLPTLLHIPSLEVLALGSVSMARPVSLFTIVSSPLRTLRLVSLNPPSSLYRDFQDISAERDWIKSLLPLVRPTLEELFIPADSTDFSSLCATPWPRLRELVIIGAVPRVEISLLRLLAMLPRLQALTLAVIYPREVPRVLIWPPNSRYGADLSGLKRLTLSSLSEDDGIFAHIPPSLEELSLRDIPRLYTQNRLFDPRSPLAAYAMHELTCNAALSIFKRMDTACLRRLELVVIEDPWELELLSHLASTCPSLASLELHTYRAISDNHSVWHNPPSIPLTALVKALSLFRALRILRLNIEYPLSQAGARLTSYTNVYDSAQFGEGIARTVVQHLPWLRSIGVLGVLDMKFIGWRIWIVGDRDASGAPALELYEHVPDR